jgi:tellurite resistance protein
MTALLSPQEALIYAMMTVAAVDRQVTEQELSRIGGIVKELPPFSGFGSDWLSREAQDCGRILAKPGGVDRVLEMIAASLPPELYETAYVLAAEVAASDLAIKAEETHFLELLADELGLDELICAALERGARARHQLAEVGRGGAR